MDGGRVDPVTSRVFRTTTEKFLSLRFTVPSEWESFRVVGRIHGERVLKFESPARLALSRYELI